METSKLFDIQGIYIAADAAKVYAYIADPANLPAWTAAFKRADDKTALMATPQGQLEVGLEVRASQEYGTIDWHMTLPTGEVASAYSRVVPSGTGAIYSFVLMAPPVPIEQVEGALAQQIKLLEEELKKLKQILEV